jgi:sporulation protein YlmC with PRC-barrel domain
MKKAITYVSAAVIGVALLSCPAGAQGTSQTVDLAKVDVQKLSAGYRASKVVGSNILNDANETIGKIDDLLVSPDGKAPFAVLSIGGFLGLGAHLVVVPYDSLKLVENKVVLRPVQRRRSKCCLSSSTPRSDSPHRRYSRRNTGSGISVVMQPSRPLSI